MKGRSRTILIRVILPALLLAVAGGCTTTSKSPPRIELSATEFNFGIIPNTAPVSRVFQVRNVGGDELTITGVSTSCGCTSAEISGRNLSPGEAADLKVTYDPQAHDGATGEFMRLVYIRSTDPDIPEATLTIRVTVVES